MAWWQHALRADQLGTLLVVALVAGVSGCKSTCDRFFEVAKSCGHAAGTDENAETEHAQCNEEIDSSKACSDSYKQLAACVDNHQCSWPSNCAPHLAQAQRECTHLQKTSNSTTSAGSSSSSSGGGTCTTPPIYNCGTSAMGTLPCPQGKVCCLSPGCDASAPDPYTANGAVSNCAAPVSASGPNAQCAAPAIQLCAKATDCGGGYSCDPMKFYCVKN
jgi:hypothetical protein